MQALRLFGLPPGVQIDRKRAVARLATIGLITSFIVSLKFGGCTGDNASDVYCWGR